MDNGNWTRKAKGLDGIIYTHPKLTHAVWWSKCQGRAKYKTKSFSSVQQAQEYALEKLSEDD